MQKLSRLTILLVIVLCCVGCDQATKSVAQSQLAGEPPIVLADNLVRFEYAENSAAFLSFGANFGPEVRYWLFTILSSLMLLGLLGYVLSELQTVEFPILVALSLFVGGGIGNMIDRVFNNGHVVDFVSIGYGPLRTGIFNVADMAILAGFIMMVLYGRHFINEPEKEAG